MPLETDTFYGPFAYGGHWLPLALGAVVLALALPVAGWFFTRPRVARPVPTMPVPPRDARRAAMAEIEAIRQAHARGTLADREAHQRLSLVVRRFVAELSGGDVDHMTLADLHEAARRTPSLGPVVAFVAAVYPPTFSREAHREVQRSLADAYEVVSRWR